MTRIVAVHPEDVDEARTLVRARPDLVDVEVILDWDASRHVHAWVVEDVAITPSERRPR